jgi:hypothetical protein
MHMFPLSSPYKTLPTQSLKPNCKCLMKSDKKKDWERWQAKEMIEFLEIKF